MSNQVVELLKKRRSQYALTKNLPLSESDIISIIKDAVKQSPSSFNSQSSRVIITFGERSNTIWEITKEALRNRLDEERFPATEARINSFAAGAGTILFYEDQNAVKNLQEQFPSYKDEFPVWSEQAAGMAQLAVWTALAEVNIGASLQHYNPLIDEALAKEFDVPSTWLLRAQMPFGGHGAEFNEKTYIDDEIRFKVFQ
jgi:predicted oxidoreductase (fatty acid repression mutant protein)